MKEAGIIIFASSFLFFATFFVVAQPSLVPAVVNHSNNNQIVVIPENAVEVAEGVFDLGFGIDSSTGKVVQGYAFVDYKIGSKQNNAKPPWAGQGGKGGDKCYSVLAKGAKWKTTESYVLNTSNLDGMSSAFVSTVIEDSLETWDSEVDFDVFGSRDLVSTIDLASIGNSVNGKNEVAFADISSDGAIAVTYTWGIYFGPPGQRELVEWDQIYDDTDYDFGDASINQDLMDFQNIATHEIGHALGLGHPSDTCTEETMYRFASIGETKKRTLNLGDVAGVNDLYY